MDASVVFEGGGVLLVGRVAEFIEGDVFGYRMQADLVSSILHNHANWVLDRGDPCEHDS